MSKTKKGKTNSTLEIEMKDSDDLNVQLSDLLKQLQEEEKYQHEQEKMIEDLKNDILLLQQEAHEVIIII